MAGDIILFARKYYLLLPKYDTIPYIKVLLLLCAHVNMQNFLIRNKMIFVALYTEFLPGTDGMSL